MQVLILHPKELLDGGGFMKINLRIAWAVNSEFVMPSKK